MMIADPPLEKSGAGRPSDSLLDAIARHSFFADLNPAHLDVLAASAMRVHYQPGELIFTQGDPANRFYLIESGGVSLEAVTPGRAPKQLEIISAGDVLGWSWLFPPYRWQFSARAVAPTSAIFVYGSQLRELCELDHDLGYELMKRVGAVMIRRLQRSRLQLVRQS